MDNLPALVFVVAAIAVFWLAWRPRYEFVIRIDNGMARAVQGKVTGAFVHQVGQACAEFTVIDGWVAGVRRGKRLSLAFSRSIPPQCQQRLRNNWLLLG